MPNDELNPQHPVTQAAHDHWHKIAALMLKKLGLKEIVLTPEDLVTPPEGLNIVLHETNGVLKIFTVDNKTAHLLAHS